MTTQPWHGVVVASAVPFNAEKRSHETHDSDGLGLFRVDLQR